MTSGVQSPLYEDLWNLVFYFLDLGEAADKLILDANQQTDKWKKHYKFHQDSSSTTITIAGSTMYHSVDEGCSFSYTRYEAYYEDRFNYNIREWHCFGVLHRRNGAAVVVKRLLSPTRFHLLFYSYSNGKPVSCVNNEDHLPCFPVQLSHTKTKIDPQIHFSAEIWRHCKTKAGRRFKIELPHSFLKLKLLRDEQYRLG